MATSQNGWRVLTSPPSGTMKWITGRIRAWHVKRVFAYLCWRFDKQVENIRPEWSWGWAFRAIRGQSSGFSNHASATAIDINAPAHPLGVDGTFSAKQVGEVHEILSDLDGVVRWGQDYSGRKDGMHFEIDKNWRAVARVSRKIRRKKLPGQQPSWKPNTAKAVHFGRVQEQFLIAAGAQKGEVTRLNGVGLMQDALNRVLPGDDITVDGLVGKATLDQWGRWEKRAGGWGRPRVPDRKSVDALLDAANLRMVGENWD